jgi:hypothetical protein
MGRDRPSWRIRLLVGRSLLPRRDRRTATFEASAAAHGHGQHPAAAADHGGGQGGGMTFLTPLETTGQQPKKEAGRACFNLARGRSARWAISSLVVHGRQSLFLPAKMSMRPLRRESQRVVEGRMTMEQIALIIDSLNDAIRDTCARDRLQAHREGAVADEEARGCCPLPERLPEPRPGAEALGRGDPADRAGDGPRHRLPHDHRLHQHGTGYAPPIPVDPADEKAELQRQFNENVLSLHKLAARIERTGKR